MPQARKLNFPVGGLNELRDEKGAVIQVPTADDFIQLSLPTVEEIAPIRETLMGEFADPHIDAEGAWQWKSPTAVLDAINAVKDIFLSELSEDDKLWLKASMNTDQRARLDTMAIELIDILALSKAKSEGITAGN